MLHIHLQRYTTLMKELAGEVREPSNVAMFLRIPGIIKKKVLSYLFFFISACFSELLGFSLSVNSTKSPQSSSSTNLLFSKIEVSKLGVFLTTVMLFHSPGPSLEISKFSLNLGG
jgi:hypothetical protein